MIATIPALLLSVVLPQEVDVRPRASADEAVAVPSWTWSADEEADLVRREAEARVQDGRFQIATGTFQVDVPGSARLAAEVSLFLDLVAARFSQEFGFKDQVSIKPTAWIYADEASFRKKCPTGEPGYFRYLWSGKSWPEFHVYTFIDPAQQKSLAQLDRSVLQHEAAHALLRRVVGRTEMPTWLDEGLAAWFQSCDLRTPRKDDAERYLRSPYLWNLRFSWVAPGGAPWPLERLFAFDASTWNTDSFGDATRAKYGAAESLIDLLLSTKNDRKILDKLVRSLANGRPIESELEKVRPALQKRWHAHVEDVLARWHRAVGTPRDPPRKG